MKSNTVKKSTGKKWARIKVAGIFCVLLGFACYFAAQWYVDVFGQMGFDSVLYTVLSGVGNAGTDLTGDFIKVVISRLLVCSGLVCGVLFFSARKTVVLKIRDRLKIRIYPLHPGFAGAISVALSVCLLYGAAEKVELPAYIQEIKDMSNIFETEYRDPLQVSITFPEEKRNLVYIFMESMESTYFAEGEGGASKYNLIPELYALAEENISFSHQETMGGLHSVSGTGWTIAAMVSQTSGVPLKVPPGMGGNEYGKDGSFLPGLNNLTRVLKEAGYYQTLMVGSEASFGGREQYYLSHGVDRVYEYDTAIADGVIPEGYHVWWGFEDKYLFEYARRELTEISKMDQPFAFTMLTVDTHHVGGYVCEYCGDAYDQQYENVISCASRQVADFVAWLTQQDFYENTTIVLVGDHCSMDSAYFKQNVPGDFRRNIYNCFINAAVTTENTRNRGACVLDMFPTTLAAMGCKIEGERLGLGTNLFSDAPTLIDELGLYGFNQQLGKTSAFYNRKFYQIQ